MYSESSGACSTAPCEIWRAFHTMFRHSKCFRLELRRISSSICISPSESVHSSLVLVSFNHSPPVRYRYIKRETLTQHTLTHKYIYIYGVGWESGFNCWDVRWQALLFYVNVYGMCPQSRLSSQPSMISAPRVFSRRVVYHSWLNASRFLSGNREADLKTTTFPS